MTSHEDKGILEFKYNYLNLPEKIKFNSTYIIRNYITGEDEIRNVTVAHTYSADGTKLNKKYTYFFPKNSTERTVTTDYLDGFQYTVSYSGIVSLDFVPTSEGYYDFKNNWYIYNYTDHLGNVRLSYRKDYLGNAYSVDENNYYPFGLRHEGYNNPGGNAAYQYNYNGKELQTESGMHDYGARMYMPELGRWGVVDPLAEKHRRHSPFNYAVNNPIIFIDPDGRDIRFGDHVYTYDKNRDYSKYNDFDANVFKALDYLYSTGALNVTIGEGKEAKTVNIMDEMINDKKNTFTILEQKVSGKKNEFDPNSKSVKFNPAEGIRFRKDGTKSSREPGNDGYNSPSSRLGHEIIHGYNLFSNPNKYRDRNNNKYDTKEGKKIFTPNGDNIGFPDEEEEYTTTILGNQMNRKLGEDERSNYGLFPSPVENVKSTKIVIPAEVRPPSTPK